MGQGAVRSQMDTRICFRVRERKDVDLVLGQGMLAAGWNAHTLNAPGKFLVSAPEHTTPKRARAYLVTDDDVARTVAYFSPHRPPLDDVSRAVLNLGQSDPGSVPWYLVDHRGDSPTDLAAPDRDELNPLEDALMAALHVAPEQGSSIAELMRATGMGRSTLYRYLAQLADDARAVQVGWAAGARLTPTRSAMSNCLYQLSLSLPRACLHVETQRQPERQLQRQPRSATSDRR